MPDASIVIRATDRFSDAMKAMSDSADKFKFRGDRCFFRVDTGSKMEYNNMVRYVLRIGRLRASSSTEVMPQLRSRTVLTDTRFLWTVNKFRHVSVAQQDRASAS